MPDISKINALAIGSVSKVDGLAKASILDIDGIAVPSAAAFLLDTYTGASAAYSVRQLKTGVTVAMRVRRDTGGGTGDDDEADVAFDTSLTDPAISLDSAISNTTSSASTLGQFLNVGTVGGTTYTNPDSLSVTASCFVDEWKDQSGNANHASQATFGSQPQIHSGTVNTDLITENGKPAVEFDGTDDTLGIADFAYSTSELGIYYTAKFDVTTKDEMIFSHYTTTGNQRSWNLRISNTYWNAVSDDGTQFFIGAGGTVQTNTLHVWEYKGSESGFDRTKVYVNGSALSLSKQGGTGTEPYSSLHNSTDDLYIASFGGTSLYHDGVIQEMIMWETTQSSNRTSIESDINTYFSVY